MKLLLYMVLPKKYVYYIDEENVIPLTMYCGSINVIFTYKYVYKLQLSIYVYDKIIIRWNSLIIESDKLCANLEMK